MEQQRFHYKNYTDTTQSNLRNGINILISAEQLFQFGLSLGSLLRLSTPDEFTRALDTLITQYEAFCTDNRTKILRVLDRFGKRDVQETTWLLELSKSPFHLDFIRTFSSVLEVLLIAYEKLGDDEAIERMEVKVWRNVVIPVLRDLDIVGNKVLNKAIANVIPERG